MPAGEGAATAPADEWDALAAQNLDAHGVARDRRAVPLEVALAHCEARLGAAWVYAPGRWPTADGCVPVRVAWATFQFLGMHRAMDALVTARGIGLAFGTEDAGRRAISQAVDEAFPEG